MNEMTEKERNQLVYTLAALTRDLGCCIKRAESLHARYARNAHDARNEEKNERNKEAERESSPHTPYKEKGEEKKKERKEVTLAHSSENDAHPMDERVCVRLKVSELFAKFWKAYPRKVAKIAARRTFERIVRSEKANAEALVETMCRALAKQRTSDEWQREDGRYIPYPATWLNAGRWEDESAVDITGGEAPASAASVAWLMGN